jgi:serine/threonine-protein kinase
MNENTMNNDVTMAGVSERALLASRYRIIRQLGQGGMGSVWLAEDTRLDGKLFAIKMLPSILVANKRAYNQLKAEALVSMKLTHPNIVTLRAFEANNGNPFLVMDYIRGKTLDRCLVDWDVLNEMELVSLLRPVAEALDYAHAKGVVHRDVKPGNVMVAEDGTPYVLDFGIAREIQETMTHVTGKFSSGTLLYMSPEQLNGDSPKKEQDIYSFAAMAYECLMGHPPFHRGQIEYQIMNNPPEPLDASGAQSIARGVMAGLAKNPEERPKTCAAVLAGEGTGSVSEESAKRAERPETGRDCVEEEGRGKAHGVGGAIAAMLAAGIFAGGVWFAMRNGEPAFEPQPPDSPVTNVVVNPSPLPPPDPVEADVTEIAVQAKVYKERIGRIDDEDGLKERKDALSDLLAQAFAYGEAKCWDKAAVSFTNYVEGCKKLIALDGKRKVVRERQNAEASRSLAIAASNRAEVVGAKKYAAGSWNDAVAKWKMADVSFDEKRFADARAEFLALKGLFDFCLQETEKSKQTEESAKQRNRTALGKLLDDPSLFPIVRRDLTDAQIGLLSGAYGKVDDAKKKLKELLMCYTGNHPEVKAVYISLKMSMEQFKDLVRKLLEDPAVDSPLIDTTGNTLKAIEAFDAKRYDEAYGLFMNSDLGNKDVQWRLGLMYEYGHGVAKNASEAVKWYRKAAE